ncbi:L-ribulose-5-phosphate 3-epimerase [Vallitalea pronyensis]|uniref:L-ribulose-5-phosphate 3-epimerase n=1 Tax=Vallitalea pronyensis TaxID=1348613 RepID=A0A8J8SGP2_9FIRM|nr:L-ribulose-5-phosphate 3-epimerase [Vallitalea pronyensis]QUI22528.1 L-ribulose-5-phosphate 3-epimerase [Vallitalea pronyensis]
MLDLNKNLIGIYEKALPSHYTWEEKLSAAKKAGYDYVEMSIDESDERLYRLDWSVHERKEVVDAIRKTGIRIPTMCLSGHRRYPLGSEDDRIRQRALDIMRKAIILASDLGIRVIQLAGYDVYYDKSNDHTIERFEHGLEQSIQWASQANVMLAMEVMDYEFMGSVEKIMHYVRKFQSPYFQIYPDLGNISAWGNTLSTDLASGQGHIVAIHAKDTMPGEFRRVDFGTGCVDFIEGFRQLNQMTYKGPILIEMWNDDKEDFMAIITNARKWIMDKMQQAGMTV